MANIEAAAERDGGWKQGNASADTGKCVYADAFTSIDSRLAENRKDRERKRTCEHQQVARPVESRLARFVRRANWRKAAPLSASSIPISGATLILSCPENGSARQNTNWPQIDH